MPSPTETHVRHFIRPLSVFSFCGQIVIRRDGSLSAKELPLCAECKRYRDKAAQLFGARRTKTGSDR